MGGLTQSLFGGSSSDSKSGNLALPYVFQNYGPWAGAGSSALGSMASILGIGGLGSAGGSINLANDGIPGDAAANGNVISLPGQGGGGAGGAGGAGGLGGSGLQNYLNSSGYNFLLDSGSKAITNNAASRGLLNSGSTLKALNQFGQNLASTKLDNYLGHLADITKISLGAGGLVSDAGQISSGQGSSSTGGLGKFIGGILASDPRVKINIEKVGEFADGLGIYEFDYNRDIDPSLPANRMRGVMADEVEKLRPWALGPTRNGYRTVNYERLDVPANVGDFL
jgi:hypothetical protein